jgi:hypothetical protein
VRMGEAGSGPVVAGQEQHAQERQTPEERARGDWGKDLATSQRADRYFLGGVEITSSAIPLSSGLAYHAAQGSPGEWLPIDRPRR